MANNEAVAGSPGTAPAPIDHTVKAGFRALAGSQKSSRGAPAYSRFVNRKLGRVFAAIGWRLGMTPNQITIISAIFTYAAIAVIAIAPTRWPYSVLIVLLLVIGYALDAADGQLARLRGGGSLAGEWLDHVADAIKSSTLHAAVLICWFRFYHLPAPVLLVPLGYQAVTAVFFFGMILTDMLRRVNRGSQAIIIRQTGPTSPIYSLAVVPADYGLLCLLFIVLWWHPVFFVLYTLLFIANFFIVVAAMIRWFRELRRLT
jgi:phosphatidylglycerophosphate synthase